MKADVEVRVMKSGVTIPVLSQILEVTGCNKIEFKKTLKNIKQYYNRLYPKYRTYFTIEITDEK